MALLIVFGGFLWNRYSHYRLLQTRLTAIQELSADYVYYDEVLTMSARMAAATGDPRWEERYLAVEKKLSAALVRGKELTPGAFAGEAMSVVDGANTKLVEMEQRAFLLVRQGHRQEAAGLLAGTPYRDQKDIYRKGIETINAGLKERAGKTLASFQRHTVFGASAFVAALLLLVFTMLGATRSLHAYIDRSRQAEAKLRALNRDLEARVADRTTTLSRANADLTNELEERRKVEAALRESEEQFRTGVASALDGIIVIDNSGNIASWNEASERMFGYSRDEVMGRDLHRLIAPLRYREAHAAHFEEFRKTGKGAAVGKTTELHGLRKDGTDFPLISPSRRSA